MRVGILSVFALLVSCGDFDPCEDVNDLGVAPMGLELTAEHLGWGESACFQCHHITRIHRASCMSPEVDVVEINTLIDVSDTRSCIACHGSNGVPRWRAEPGGGS